MRRDRSFCVVCAQVLGTPNPVPDWLPQSSWQSVLALREIADYHALPEDLVSSSKRWREWLELERPEDEPLPGKQCCFELLDHPLVVACRAICSMACVAFAAQRGQLDNFLTCPAARPCRRLEAHARV